MRITSVEIRNFRAVEHIEVEFDNRVNVIVGPNAVGKTTILEAIRFAKAVLAPRTQNESTQVLASMGMLVPGVTQQINFLSVARDSNSPVAVRCCFEFDQSELQILESSIQQIAQQFVMAQIGQGFSNQVQLISYLNSPQGLAQVKDAATQFTTQIKAKSNAPCVLGVRFAAGDGGLTPTDPLDPFLFQFLDQKVSPYETLFSYFPADRALPAGDPGIQIGAPDIAQQLESHNSQPQLKYARLKNTIFNARLMNDESNKTMEATFEAIFQKILKDKKLKHAGLSQYGTISIEIEDTASGRTFQLDGLSSGEKGLILTFLTIARSVAHGGIVLLDEPELHLNPAICSPVLNFIAEQFAQQKNMQFVICSHSAEILSATFSREDCSLYHLKSEKLVTKVRLRDQRELTDAFRRLGASEADNLLYSGNIYVEGTDDEEILRACFPDALKRYKIKDLGGRREIEKHIKRIQEAEKRGEDVGKHIFVFDLDRAPSELTSSSAVKVLQWNRRNIENYLIDDEAIFDVLKSDKNCKTPFENLGIVKTTLKGLALSQIEELAVKIAYSALDYGTISYEKKDFKKSDLQQTAQSLYNKLNLVRIRLANLSGEDWQKTFLALHKENADQLNKDWQATWSVKCDGKKLLSDLGQSVVLKSDERQFKLKIGAVMRQDSRPAWVEMRDLLLPLLP